MIVEECHFDQLLPSTESGSHFKRLIDRGLVLHSERLLLASPELHAHLGWLIPRLARMSKHGQRVLPRFQLDFVTPNVI